MRSSKGPRAILLQARGGVRSQARRFFREESAQASVEYTLVLAIVVGLVLILIKKLLQPAFATLRVSLSNRIEKTLFGGDLHRLKTGR